MNVKIYHNPRCSKSRQTLQLLQDRGIQPEIIEYLKNSPSEAQLEELLQLLKLEPREVMRQKEPEYQALNLSDPQLSRTALISILHNHPKLLERPIVIASHKAIIGRPPEAVLSIL